MVLENKPPDFETSLLNEKNNSFPGSLVKRTLHWALACPGPLIVGNLKKWSILIGVTRVTSESFFLQKNAMKTVLKPRFPGILVELVCY